MPLMGLYLCQMAEEARLEAIANRQEAIQEDLGLSILDTL